MTFANSMAFRKKQSQFGFGKVSLKAFVDEISKIVHVLSFSDMKIEFTLNEFQN